MPACSRSSMSYSARLPSTFTATSQVSAGSRSSIRRWTRRSSHRASSIPRTATATRSCLTRCIILQHVDRQHFATCDRFRCGRNKLQHGTHTGAPACCNAGCLAGVARMHYRRDGWRFGAAQPVLRERARIRCKRCDPQVRQWPDVPYQRVAVANVLALCAGTLRRGHRATSSHVRATQEGQSPYSTRRDC